MQSCYLPRVVPGTKRKELWKSSLPTNQKRAQACLQTAWILQRGRLLDSGRAQLLWLLQDPGFGDGITKKWFVRQWSSKPGIIPKPPNNLLWILSLTADCSPPWTYSHCQPIFIHWYSFFTSAIQIVLLSAQSMGRHCSVCWGYSDTQCGWGCCGCSLQ